MDDREDQRLIDQVEKDLLALESEVETTLEADDGETLRSMPAARRRKAVRRLAVIQAWRSSRRSVMFADAADAARRAGVSLPTFYRLLEATPKPTLSGLGLHVAPRASKKPDRISTAAAEAAALLATEQPATAATLMERLGTKSDVAISRATAARTLVEARRHAPSTRPFGSLLALDAASLDVVDLKGFRQRFYAVLDVSTGLVLSWCLAADRMFEVGYAGVANAYLRASTKRDLDGIRDIACMPEVVEMEVSVPRDADLEFAKALHRSHSSGRTGATLVTDPRAIGGRLRAAVGGRLAGFGLAAGFAPPDRFHRSGVRTSLPTLTEAAISKVAAQIATHNRERLDLATPGNGGGAMEDVKRIMKAIVAFYP